MKRYTINGFEILEYEEASSTNVLAEQLTPAGLKDKDVVLTFRQTQGRGQVGNKWESAPGCNICMTVVFKPDALKAGSQFAISMISALGCYDFISRYVDRCTIKWPNDLYVGDRKIVGILIEHCICGPRIACSFCGIGVNINQEKFLSDAPNPVSLFQLIGRKLPLRQALSELLQCIGSRYQQVNDYNRLEKEYMQVLYRKEGMHLWEDETGLFEAAIAGLDEFGRLLLRDKDGREKIYGFKEVIYR